MSKEKIIIFDTTLRDGEQSPGMSMNREEKLLVASVLDNMGVDVIEAGFAIASEGDFQAVKAIAKATKNASVCSLARAKKIDIERAAEALKPAGNPRIHTFISTSPLHLQYQLNMSEAQVLEEIKSSVTLARNFTDNVEWSAMDATRSDKDYLCKAVETAISCGAVTVNIPDTVGYATPPDYAELITYLRNNVVNIDKAVISVHCQNDLGLATANSLAGALAGARQIECTINGIGERAGNTSLEEVVMTIKTRSDIYDFKLDIDTTQIMHASRLVQNITGASVQVNKAIVGANAFAHESGIHQDGMLKHSGTYEIMTPESVGLAKSNLVLGKHSGRHAFADKLRELNIELGDNAFADAFEKFKALADKKKEIFDEDIITIVDAQVLGAEQKYQFVALNVNCGSEKQEAQLTLKIDGKEQTEKVTGSGPVDAAFKAIKKLTGFNGHLQIYHVDAVTKGTDAQAETTVRLEHDGTIVNGNGADVDTIVASVKAYINALERLDRLEKIHRINLLDS